MNKDVLFEIFKYLTIEELLDLEGTIEFDEEFWKKKAYHDLGEDFWERASKRPKGKSKPLKTWREELIRIYEFSSILKESEEYFDKNDYYKLWNLIDGEPRFHDNCS